jgi:hypothetical protein
MTKRDHERKIKTNFILGTAVEVTSHNTYLGTRVEKLQPRERIV